MSQQNKTTLQSAINTQLADNTSGDISASDIRDNLINITDSLLFNTGSQSITGSLTITERVTLVSASTSLTIGEGAINLQSTSSTIIPSIILASSGGVPKYIKIGMSGIYSSLVANGDLYFYGSNSVNIESNNDVNIWSRLNATQGVIVTGSLTTTGGITGSLQGTASYTTQALSASYALSSSFATTAGTATSATNATTAGTAGLITFYPDPSDINYAILFTDQTNTSNPGVSAPLYDSNVNVFTYNPFTNRLSLTGSLTISSTGQVVIITGLSTSEPITSGQLWLSGSTSNSKFLCVRN